MVLEVAVLNVIPDSASEFEKAFENAEGIISDSKGYINHQLQKCIEVDFQYILLVNWETLEDHTEGFRKSEEYERWKKLLHHFYNPFPTVHHYFSTSNNVYTKRNDLNETMIDNRLQIDN